MLCSAFDVSHADSEYRLPPVTDIEPYVNILTLRTLDILMSTFQVNIVVPLVLILIFNRPVSVFSVAKVVKVKATICFYHEQIHGAV